MLFFVNLMISVSPKKFEAGNNSDHHFSKFMRKNWWKYYSVLLDSKTKNTVGHIK